MVRTRTRPAAICLYIWCVRPSGLQATDHGSESPDPECAPAIASAPPGCRLCYHRSPPHTAGFAPAPAAAHEGVCAGRASWRALSGWRSERLLRVRAKGSPEFVVIRTLSIQQPHDDPSNCAWFCAGGGQDCQHVVQLDRRTDHPHSGPSSRLSSAIVNL